MSLVSSSSPEVRQQNFRFRCIACGDVNDVASQNFRCAHCGDLLEISYPAWKEATPSAASLKSTWQKRRLSSSAVDLSGVWRFRDLLPALDDEHQVITLREGNTPLYELTQCARITGVPRLFAKHQGITPGGSLRGGGMRGGAPSPRRAGFSWVACAST